MQSCCSPIASASAAAPQLHQSRFGCCSPFASASAAVADCIGFSCCSPIDSASAAAHRLRPLQLLLPDCVCFDCCSPIASACSTSYSSPMISNILCGVRGSVNLEVQRSCVTSLVPPAPQTSHFRHAQTHTHTHTHAH